ncbi:MAG: hypothetical protein R3E04_04350 [Sphingobium sp.]
MTLDSLGALMRIHANANYSTNWLYNPAKFEPLRIQALYAFDRRTIILDKRFLWETKAGEYGRYCRLGFF